MGNMSNISVSFRRGLEISWLAIIFFIPLFFNPLSHQAFYLNKALLLQFLVMVMLAFLVGGWIYSRTRQNVCDWRSFLISPLHIAVLVFGILMIVATIASIMPSTSFWGSYFRKSGLLTQIAWLIFFLVVSSQIKCRAQLFRAICALLLSSGLVSIIGILQYFYPGILLNYEVRIIRVFSTVGNALSLSIFLASVMPLTVAFILNLWKKRKEDRKYNILILVLAVLLALQFSCLYLAQYSILLLLYIIGLIIFFLLFGIVRRIKALFVFCTASLILIVVVAGLIMVPVLFSEFSSHTYKTNDYLPIINAEDLNLSTLELRAQYWHSATDIIVDSPEIPFSNDGLHAFRKIIGYGPETFTITFQRAFPEVVKDHSLLLIPLSRPHNHYLYLATTMGLLGLVSFLSILIVFFYLSFKYLRRAAQEIDKFIIISLVAGMVGFMADSIFNPSTISAELVFWLFLSLVIVMGRLISNDKFAAGLSQTQDGPNNIEILRPNIVRSSMSFGCLVLLIVIGITITIRPTMTR